MRPRRQSNHRPGRGAALNERAFRDLRDFAGQPLPRHLRVWLVGGGRELSQRGQESCQGPRGAEPSAVQCLLVATVPISHQPGARLMHKRLYSVYYIRPEFWRELSWGDIVPTRARLHDTHAYLKMCMATDLEDVFVQMQG